MTSMAMFYFHYQFELIKTMVAKLSPQRQSSESQSNITTETDSQAQFTQNDSAPQKSQGRNRLDKQFPLPNWEHHPKKNQSNSESINIDHT
jgi:hypothetical protein